MKEAQARLFPYPKPLLERFGPAFFRNIPSAPGVYLMAGEGERVLYVGQSRNLRQRISSYKHVQPDRASRKLVRLVHLVRRITWEECATAEEARLRENELLRAHRPAFNSMNVRPEMYYYVGFRLKETTLELWLASVRDAEDACLFGAFKGRHCVRRGFAALLRLIWILHFQPGSSHDLPSALVAPEPPDRFELPGSLLPENMDKSFRAFLNGTSDSLIEFLAGATREACAGERFMTCLHASDLEALKEFYQRGPERNRHLRRHYRLDMPLLEQAQLDDLLVNYSPDRTEVAPDPGKEEKNEIDREGKA